MRNYYNTTPQEQRNNTTEVRYIDSTAHHVTKNTLARPEGPSTYAFANINKTRHMCRKSKFAQHLLDEGHDFGPMENVMDIVQYANKGRMMDTLEKFYIYELTCRGSQINDQLTIQRNPIFETTVRHSQHKRDH